MSTRNLAVRPLVLVGPSQRIWDYRYPKPNNDVRYTPDMGVTKFCNDHWDLRDGKIIHPQISKTKKEKTIEMFISCIPHF